MLFKDVIGNKSLKKFLVNSVDSEKVSHCQLFSCFQGSGGLPMAISYARKIISKQSSDPGSCNKMIANLTHPDLHFVFPVINTVSNKTKAISSNYLTIWRDFVFSNPYAGLYDWYSFVGFEKKQGKIGVDEAENLVKKMNLKSYCGGWKCAIIWMVEKINPVAANKLLKLIEEPPKKTLFIFITENENSILETLKSRCLLVNFNKISVSEIEKALIARGISSPLASKAAISSGGDFSAAISIANGDLASSKFEDWFQSWVRLAFKVKGNIESVLGILDWSKKISLSGKEVQKSFLLFSLELFRQAYLTNSGLKNITTYKSTSDFNFQKFSDYISNTNIEDIFFELEKAYKSIESNGNSNMIFTDLSLKLTRLIHR